MKDKTRKLLRRAHRNARRLEVLLVSVAEKAYALKDCGGDGPYDHAGIAEALATEAESVAGELRADLKKLRRRAGKAQAADAKKAG
jgi:hypothetical protein